MFVYSRRALQTALNDLMHSGSLDSHQIKTLTARLNANIQDRISAMWEVIYLAAISKVGPFEHEKPLEGSTREPDFSLPIPFGAGMLRIVGDITAVSDSWLHEQNPIRYLREEVVRLATKNRLDPNHFSVRVSGANEGDYASQKTRLSLPKKGNIQQIVKKEIEPFIQDLSLRKVLFDRLSVKGDKVDFDIGYNTSQRFMSSGHLSYTTIYSLRKNTIANQLNEKAKQLRGAPEDAVRLLILCDGGCDAMKDGVSLGINYKADRIVQDFLDRTNSIDYVLLVRVVESQDFINGRSISMKYDLATAHAGKASKRVTPESKEAMRAFLNKVIEGVPKPRHTPYNAAINAHRDSIGIGARGGYSISASKMRISLRTLQELLAGVIDTKEFMHIQGWDETTGIGNLFKVRLEDGRLISSMKVIPGDDLDDDWVEFEFGPSDPAIARFNENPLAR